MSQITSLTNFKMENMFVLCAMSSNETEFSMRLD